MFTASSVSGIRLIFTRPFDVWIISSKGKQRHINLIFQLSQYFHALVELMKEETSFSATSLATIAAKTKGLLEIVRKQDVHQSISSYANYSKRNALAANTGLFRYTCEIGSIGS
jgi:hypothetical protein